MVPRDAKFLSSLARAKRRSVPPLLRKRVEQPQSLRWGSLFSHGRHSGIVPPGIEVVACVPNVTWPLSVSLSERRKEKKYHHSLLDGSIL